LTNPIPFSTGICTSVMTRVRRATVPGDRFVQPPPARRGPPRAGQIANLCYVAVATLDMAAVNLAGNPALAIPIPLPGKAVSVTSLQIVGPRLSEAKLLNAGRLIEVRH
jgi:Asp-tRNA(Asn)/Glu-tRNA(Gln) amidotransferase A subunit family amidase